MFNETSKALIAIILQRMYEEITSYGETIIMLDENNVFAAKGFQPAQHPRKINDYDVPILRFSKLSKLNIPWDISINFVLNRIDGVSTIKNIALKWPTIDEECVQRCVMTLLFYDCVIISDTVKLTNVYEHCNLDSFINLENSHSMDEIIEFCCVSKVILSHADFIRFLMKFRFGEQLGKVLMSTDILESLIGVDLRRLLAILQEKKLLRRVHEYPIYIYNNNNSNNNNSNMLLIDNTDTSKYESTEIPWNSNRSNRSFGLWNEKSIQNDENRSTEFSLSYLDGSTCLDAICCRFKVTSSEVLVLPGVTVIYK